MLWKPIFNYSVDKIDLRNCNGEEDRYIFTRKLLLDYPEREKNVAYIRARAEMDVLQG